MIQLYARVGDEVLVNTATQNNQTRSAVASLTSGGYVITWQDESGVGGDRSSNGIKAQLFAADGTKLGAEFLVNSQTLNAQEVPTVSALAGGGFVVAWNDKSGLDGDTSLSVRAQVFDASGSKVGAEFLVNTETAYTQTSASIAGLTSGGFVITWEDSSAQGGDSSDRSVKGQLFDASGATFGPEFLVNTSTASSQHAASVAPLSSGGFVVTWQDHSTRLGDRVTIAAQIFDAFGTKLGAEFRVNTAKVSLETDPVVTELASGGFVISWVQADGDGSAGAIKAQIFDASGAKLGGEFLVNTTRASHQMQPTVEALPDGGFIAAWTDASLTGDDRSSRAVRSQVFDEAGRKVGTEFVVNETTYQTQEQPTIAVLEAGEIVISWTDLSGAGGDAAGYSVKSQIFAPSVAAASDIAVSATTVLEDIAENTPFATVSGTGAVNSELSFSVAADSAGGAFGIIGNHLVVTNSALLDFESAQTATVTLRATDVNGNSFDEQFTLSIADSAQESRYSAGAEFLPMTEKGGIQTLAASATLSAGGFVMVWCDDVSDGTEPQPYWFVRGQIFDDSGAKVGGEFVASRTYMSVDGFPTVAALESGGFVVSWVTTDHPNPKKLVTAQLFDPAGAKVGPELVINSESTNSQSLPAAAGHADGYTVAWIEYKYGWVATQDGSEYAASSRVMAQTFDLNGAPAGAVTALSGWVVADRPIPTPTITTLASGAAVVSWVEPVDGDLGVTTYIGVVQMLDADGAKTGTLLLDDGEAALGQIAPSVDALASGGFVVSWLQYGEGANTIRVQIFSAEGAKVGAEIGIDPGRMTWAEGPRVAALDTGGFVVSWSGTAAEGFDREGSAAKAQVFSADGTPIGPAMLVNSTTAADQIAPLVTDLGGGNFAVAWTDMSGQGGDVGAGLKARIFTVADSAIAKPDAFATNEATRLVGSLFSDNGQGTDRDAGGEPLRIAAVNGSAESVGSTITLASGARLIVNANGTFSYDPRGALAHLAGPGSGAFNLSATESFTYILANGNAATVRLTVNGLVSAGDRLIGTAGTDVMRGSVHNDFISGLAGADRMEGGAGHDLYVVDSARDLIVEASAGGLDTIESSISYTLGANVENLQLTGAGGTSATGNALANKLLGNAGANILNGMGGADRMEGANGNDRYIVDNLGDVAFEASAGGGIDTVESGVSFALGANVENLRLTGTAAANASGNGLANLLFGNGGANVLNGGAGADRMDGGAGNDRYIIDNVRDIATESSASGGIDTVESSVSFTLGTNVENLRLTGNAASNGTGNGLANLIFGNGGANVLNGGAGADRMDGGGGNDRYVIDNVRDVAIETSAGGGIDTVESSATHTLGANIENLRLIGTSWVNATGNALANILFGNGGGNTLNGGAGADRMDGGAGNDRYIIDNVRDVAIEMSAGGGIDTVESSVSFTLGANIDNLRLVGTSSLNATGNALNNLIFGNGAANTLNGGAGADRMTGGAGNDRYIIDHARDVAVETDPAGGVDTVESSVSYALGANLEHLRLGGVAANGTGNGLANLMFGNGAANALDGGAGDDTLHGGAGTDTLKGGVGLDRFAFDTALGSGNIDKILDFSVVDDSVVLENAIFKGLAAGALASGAFRSGAAAADADDRIVYNSATGALLFDADGSGAGAAIQFATLQTGLTSLSATDFAVI